MEEAMSRPVILFSGSWAEVPLEELSTQAAGWGYQGLDLCCWGDHFEVQRALAEEGYVPGKLALLRRLELDVHVLRSHRASQAGGDERRRRRRHLVTAFRAGRGHPASAQ